MISSAIGGHVPNSYTVVTLFGVDGLSLNIVDGSWSSRCLNYKYEKFGWPTAILFLAPAEDWKGPSGPAGDLQPHLK